MDVCLDILQTNIDDNRITFYAIIYTFDSVILKVHQTLEKVQ